MSARFGPGAAVRVRDARPPGHLRTPWYIRGKAGTVAEIAGRFANPEELAFGRDGLPARTLYRVRFRQTEIWPGYDGPVGDTLDIEIYEHWLEPAEHKA
jgi:nitrile hydratase